MSDNGTGTIRSGDGHRVPESDAAAILRGLARAFTYPDRSWVASLLGGQWLEALDSVLASLGVSATGLRRAVEALPESPAAALRVLEVEYTYLFINAIPHVPAPPYASAYTAQGLLMGEPAEAAVVAYRQAGLALSSDYRDLPDHLATELEFLAWLGEQAQDALEAGDEALAWSRLAQREVFLERQVNPWLSHFCWRVVEAARLPFYRELARLALALLPTILTPHQADSSGGN